MRIAFIGAGRLAQTLAAAFHLAGWTVAAVSSRTARSSNALAKVAGACLVVEDPQEAVDLADLVFITVPDDSIGTVAASLRWSQRHSVVHCSGATEVSVLAVAAGQGAAIGGFHPLQLFADPILALPRIAGSSVAVEAPLELQGHLRTLAESIGYRVITLTAGTRAIYHVSTNYSASFLLSLLREACDIWNGFGVSDEDALTALLPLARGALEAAGAKGLAGAIAGPISRGDISVVRAHLDSLKGIGDDAVEFYRILAHRQIRLARDKGGLNAGIISRLEEAIDS